MRKWRRVCRRSVEDGMEPRIEVVEEDTIGTDGPSSSWRSDEVMDGNVVVG
jgi:hypothetical protein